MTKYNQQDWFSFHIPVWTPILESMKDKPVKALEIGSFEGRSTIWLLENILTHKDSTITCIDPFKDYSDLEKFPIDWAQIRQTFIENMKPFEGRVNHIEQGSTDALINLIYTGHSFDFIYVDGDHTSSQCLIDGVLSHLLLKSGGIVIFDDYMWAKLAKAPNVPRSAIDSFIECFANEYEMLSSGYQVILRKV